MDLTYIKVQLITEKSHNFLYCSQYLGQSSQYNKCTTKTIHKSDLNICRLHRYICSNHNSLPWCHTDDADRLSCMILALMYAYVQCKILINN